MTVLADHSLWLALPAFAPAVVVAGVVAWVAVRDRRAGPEGGSDSENAGLTDEDGSA